MKFLSIFAAVTAHYVVGSYFNNVALNFPKLCILLGICVNLCENIKNGGFRRCVFCWLALLEGALFCFVMIEIGLHVIWELFEKITTHVFSTVLKTSNSICVKMNSVNIVLCVVAFIFLIRTIKSCSSFKFLFKNSVFKMDH